MKKIILIAAAITSIISNAIAQEERLGVVTDVRSLMMFGLKAGMNYSNVYDTKGEQFNAKAKFGFAGGGFLSIPIGKYLGIQPEILFSKKGFHATSSILGSSYDLTRTTSYVDLPIFLHLNRLNS